MKQWYENKYRRHLLDMHIDDWDERFLSEFSPETYVENLKKARIQSAMIYVQSHVGLCNYPTKAGKMHNAFVGKEDTMRRLIALCHENGISVVAYYSLVYNTWARDAYPQWRIMPLSEAKKQEETGNEKEKSKETDDFGKDYVGSRSMHCRVVYCHRNAWLSFHAE
jgi:hypothetical protein